ncbi:response regulator transcription factor [Paenibacillus sp. Aloe-11]|uniref:response regulator transcription factor n=1 Tax=Paenibacillus sp. Aloe-11 TaxID=1050222 RepID=UPI00024F05DD|nr:response regulator transcription factor [Paenibacillus sp. Aloe-11]EHS59868.1 two component transcriptional regulator, arac family [Paenibacillus sp. Aloe-11]
MNKLCNILIVDDEILVRQGIKHHLSWEKYGFRIVGEASNGKEALALIETLRPHIVITDIVMPIMDGEELTRIVKQNYPEIEVIVLSSYGEFNYVRSTFQQGVADYILKPKLDTDELLQVLQRTARKIPSIQYQADAGDNPITMDHVIEKLISGYSIDYDTELLKQTFPYTRFALIGMEQAAQQDTGRSYSASDLFSRLTDRMADACEQKIVLRLLPSDVHAAVVLANLDPREADSWMAAVREVAQETKQADPQIGWAVSHLFDDFNRISEVYQDELPKLLSYRFYFPETALLMEDELPQPVQVNSSFNLKQFTEEMKREHFDAAFQDLRSYVAAMSRNYNSTAFEFKSLLGNIVFNITILLGNQGYDMKELDAAKYSYFKTINDAPHVHEAVRLLETFLEEANRQIMAKTQQGGSASMKKLLEYIEEHHAETLNLTTLGQYFHFNPSYLSSYFTTHHTEGFSEYLNKIRVEKAAELLRSGIMPISDISSTVGYSDPSYFTKVFKKVTGYSPSQYRREHLH